jgi:Glycosyl transferases group 1
VEGSPVVRTNEPEAPRSGVSVEVSALQGGTRAESAFVTFVLGVLRESDSFAPTAFSTRWLRRADRPTGVATRPQLRPWVAGRVAAMGVPASSSWAVRGGAVLHLASGPSTLAVPPPAVVTVHRVAGVLDGAPSRRRLELLRRAAGDGVVVHAVSHRIADALVEIGVDRAAIVVATPGVRFTAPHAGPSDHGSSIVVLEGASRAKDLALLDALRAGGAVATLVESIVGRTECACAVLASPDDAFPLSALEAVVAGTPVVAARSSTTTELLEGAATLVDPSSLQDMADAAIDLASNGGARGIAIAAGRARAADYSWDRRSAALNVVLRRALAAA